MRIADAFEQLIQGALPLRFTAYDGSASGPEDAPFGLDLRNERGLAYLMTAPGDLGLGRAYVAGDLGVTGVTPGDPYEALKALKAGLKFRRPSPAELVTIVSGLGVSHLKPPSPPKEEFLPRWRRVVEGVRHSRTRDKEAIHHHYDVSNTFYEHVLGPSMTYTCAVYPNDDATLEQAQHYKYDLVARKLDLKPGMRLLDVGCGWGGMVRHAAQHYGVKAVGVTLSREQATWAQEKIKEMGLDHLAEVRHSDYREVTETGFDAVSSIGLTEHIGIRNYPSYFGFLSDRLRPHGRLLNHCITRPHNRNDATGAVHRPLRLPRRRADRLGQDHHRGPERRARGAARGELPAALRAHARGLVPQPGGELGRVRRRGRRGHGAGVGPLHGRLAAGVRAQRDPAPPRARDQDRR